MKTIDLLVMALAGMTCSAFTQLPAQHSALWGTNGEAWSPRSRLPDFSFAGYQRGERAIPDLFRAASVTDFGACGDDDADDTQAFLSALAKVKAGAIEIPAGRFILTNILYLTRSNVVLRGAGPDKTTLFFPRPLHEVRPGWTETTTGDRVSKYSWSGGFIMLRGKFNSDKITNIMQPATRGDQVVTVATAKQLSVGQEVEIYQTDTPTNSLAIHLYSDDSGPVENLLGKARYSHVTRITRLDGNRVSFDRPLRCDLHGEWQPQVRAFAPTLTESGVEHLAFEFPATPYAGHFTETGWNVIMLENVAHCWIRNLRIRNADNGPFVLGFFNTVDGLVFESERAADRGAFTGHHGFSFTAGADNLFQNFDFQTRFIHDITVCGYTCGNVTARGRGVELSLDHHCYAPHENLFTDLDAGTGQRLWKCGGGAKLGKRGAARNTFWNIRAPQPLPNPPADFGPPTMNFVGLPLRGTNVTAPEGKWIELIPPAALQPQNLHEAQRAQRRLEMKVHSP